MEIRKKSNKEMIVKQFEEVRWLEFELLQDLPLSHGSFMRYGGVSKGVLESLNVGKHVGDTLENIEANLNKIKQALSLDQLICSRICHSDEVAEITSANMEDVPISDGLMTSLKSIGIAVSQADCQAAIFYDPTWHVMANVHCGWRSSVKNIYRSTVDAMKSRYGCDPADLLVCISPSLGPEHSEFIHFRTELPREFDLFKIKECHFDFWAISKWQLIEAGILPDHIQVASVDTFSNLDYFSYRRSQLCGRQATVCALH